MRRIFYGSNKKGKTEYTTSLTEDSKIKTYSMLRRDSIRSAAKWKFPQLYCEKLPIGATKLKDLLDVLPLISEDSWPYYLNLKAAGNQYEDEFY